MVKIPAPRIPASRKQLSADALFQTIQQDSQEIPDHRTGNATISLTDSLMSGFAVAADQGPVSAEFFGNPKKKIVSRVI